MHLAAYLASAELLASTSATTTRASIIDQELVQRSYVGSPRWEGGSNGLGSFRIVQTAMSDRAPIIIGAERAEDPAVAELNSLLELGAGWDGEDAAPPHKAAIQDAIHFLYAAGSLATNLSPTLHVDGSVLLELDDGSAGSLRFRGNGTIGYAVRGIGFGSVPFDGATIPPELRHALEA
jgi:hypothetical protein